MVETLLEGDAAKLLDAVQSESVDFVFADYPFYIDDEVVEKTANELYRVLKPEGNCAVINNPSNHFKYQKHFDDFNFRNGIVLERPYAFHPAWHVGFKHNYLWLLYKDDRDKWYGNKTNHEKGLTDVWEDLDYEVGFNADGHHHPEAISEELTERIIKLHTEEGDLVLDPFFGSGTTGVVCDRFDRDWIGIEIEDEYVDLARKRLRTDWSKHEGATDW